MLKIIFINFIAVFLLTACAPPSAPVFMEPKEAPPMIYQAFDGTIGCKYHSINENHFFIEYTDYIDQPDEGLQLLAKFCAADLSDSQSFGYFTISSAATREGLKTHTISVNVRQWLEPDDSANEFHKIQSVLDESIELGIIRK